MTLVGYYPFDMDHTELFVPRWGAAPAALQRGEKRPSKVAHSLGDSSCRLCVHSTPAQQARVLVRVRVRVPSGSAFKLVR